MRLFPVVNPGMSCCGGNKNFSGFAADFLFWRQGVAVASLLSATPSFAQAYVSSVPALTPAVPTYYQPTNPYQTNSLSGRLTLSAG